MNSFEEGKKAAELNQPRKVPNKYQGDKVHKLRWLSGFDSIKIKEQKMNSFQNGVAKAEQEIMNKANSVGVKLKNVISDDTMKAKGYKYKIELPSGKGEDLYTKDFNAAKEMAKEYGAGTKVTELK